MSLPSQLFSSFAQPSARKLELFVNPLFLLARDSLCWVIISTCLEENLDLNVEIVESVTYAGTLLLTRSGKEHVNMFESSALFLCYTLMLIYSIFSQDL